MPDDYVICARNIDNGGFGDEPEPSTYLFVPTDAQPKPEQKQEKKAWVKRVIVDATKSAALGEDGFGNILVFVHGFNNNQATVMERHRQLRDDLMKRGFPGIVVSFDWPSGDVGVLYLEDRGDAKKSALQLVSDGILPLAEEQRPDCHINVHLLAHSMGALVVREAFDDADDRGVLTGMSWIVSQTMLIGGDISNGSLSADNSSSESLYRHSVRLTNYQNRHDSVLGLSNVKRAGAAPRVGRWGLPNDAPASAVNVDCSDYWDRNYNKKAIRETIGNKAHSWHIGDPVFTADMLATMMGVDRMEVPTRVQEGGKLVLKELGA